MSEIITLKEIVWEVAEAMAVLGEPFTAHDVALCSLDKAVSIGTIEDDPDEIDLAMEYAEREAEDAMSDGTKYWVVLDNGRLLTGLTGSQYSRYSEQGRTQDGGQE